MNSKAILKDWIIEALNQKNGKAHLTQICKFVWENHQQELNAAGDLFYTWQYDIRWAAQKLRDAGILKPIEEKSKGIWELN